MKALSRYALATGEGNVRAIDATIRFDTDGEQRVVDLLVQLKEVWMGRSEAGPENRWISALGKCTDARDGQQERLHLDGSQLFLYLLFGGFIYFTDKLQGQVEVISLGPTKMWQLLVQSVQSFFDEIGKGNGDKQTRLWIIIHYLAASA